MRAGCRHGPAPTQARLPCRAQHQTPRTAGTEAARGRSVEPIDVRARDARIPRAANTRTPLHGTPGSVLRATRLRPAAPRRLLVGGSGLRPQVHFGAIEPNLLPYG